MKVDVRTDFREVERLLASVPSRVVDQSATRALSRAVDSGRTAMVRAISREYALTAGFVRERLRVSAVRGGVGSLTLSATLAARGKRGINLIRFLERSVTLAEGRRRGREGTQARLRIRIKRAGGLKLAPEGSFIGNKGRTIFQRVGSARLPIKPVTTIDVPSMFNARRLNDLVTKTMRDVFLRRFAYEAERALSRRG